MIYKKVLTKPRPSTARYLEEQSCGDVLGRANAWVPMRQCQHTVMSLQVNKSTFLGSLHDIQEGSDEAKTPIYALYDNCKAAM